MVTHILRIVYVYTLQDSATLPYAETAVTCQIRTSTPRLVKINLNITLSCHAHFGITKYLFYVRFQVLTAASMMFRDVFWVVHHP
jgi:hypothetical protein